MPIRNEDPLRNTPPSPTTAPASLSIESEMLFLLCVYEMEEEEEWWGRRAGDCLLCFLSSVNSVDNLRYYA